MPASLKNHPAKPPGTFRVLHTADWHLGKRMGDLPRDQEHALFLDFLVQTIDSLDIDALLIAGDVFDSANPPQSAQARYYNLLSRLHERTSCSVVVIAGNHDSPAQLEAPRDALTALRVRVVGAVPDDPSKALIPLPDAVNAKIVVAAVPFLRDRDLRTGRVGESATDIQKQLVGGIRRRYADIAEAASPWREKNVPVLATGHLTVTGCSTNSDGGRGIHIGGLGSVGADLFPESIAYLALGHLHRPQSAGKCDHIRYAGSPIPLSFSESADQKELRLLEFSDGRLVGNTGVPIPIPRTLTQHRTTRGELSASLASLHPAVSELKPWVEVIIDDPVSGESLFETILEETQNREFDVVRVVARRETPVAGLEAVAGGITAHEQELLDDPVRVFERRLAVEDGLTDSELDALCTAFEELVDLHHEHARDKT